MISPRNLFTCLVCLASCTSQQKEASDNGDSTLVAGAPKSARHEPRSTVDGLIYEIDSALDSQELTLFGKSETIPYWISRFYSQDHLVKSKNDTPHYLIKEVELTEDEYIDIKGECVKRPVLVVLRVLTG